jgi:hypothetical protein
MSIKSVANRGSYKCRETGKANKCLKKLVEIPEQKRELRRPKQVM